MEDKDNFTHRPYFVYEFETSYVEMGKNQFWEGYCILFTKGQYDHLTDMPIDVREKYLIEMSILGDAMMEVLQARRINYSILGNSHPVTHAHLFPRYDWEDETLGKSVVWRYDDEVFQDPKYAFSEKHASLKQALAEAIERHYITFLESEPYYD
ncbi:diadenosine tetraphosphate (Ap4A) HIT family hydrolase [Streptococcus rupicaprae]|uniref:Diadenosine tetraphosphate (Ap4A) HIT family hydrolase n=1 Tax=Streptococcus rupicaprae TaxID=759619 RepID=A0ABV2FGH1_9STRE